LIPGQTSFIASSILFTAFASERRLCRGALLGAVLTLKPQLAVMAPLFLIVRREWIALAAMAVVAVLVALMTTIIFGVAIWSDWLSAIPAFQQIVAHRGLSMSAVSPAAFATTLGLPRLPLLVVGCAAGVLVALRSAGLDNRNQAAMIACASLFAAPYALRYDMIAIAPAMAVVILSERSRKALLACITYSATFGPFSLAAGTCVMDWQSLRAKPVKPG
jgi:hypothetical protein